jgi:hypothetical protein
MRSISRSSSLFSNRQLHSSSLSMFKTERKIQDKKFRIHLFDFDEMEPVIPNNEVVRTNVSGLEG